MKTAIRILTPMITLGLCIWGDVALVKFLFTQLPIEAAWLFWAKLGIILGIIAITAGIIFVITALSALIVRVFTE